MTEETSNREQRLALAGEYKDLAERLACAIGGLTGNEDGKAHRAAFEAAHGAAVARALYWIKAAGPPPKRTGVHPALIAAVFLLLLAVILVASAAAVSLFE